MEDTKKCPDCKDGKMVRGDGALEQSGITHLVTTTWECPCGRKEFEPARMTPWSTTEVREPLTGKVLSKPRLCQ